MTVEAVLGLLWLDSLLRLWGIITLLLLKDANQREGRVSTEQSHSQDGVDSVQMSNSRRVKRTRNINASQHIHCGFQHFLVIFKKVVLSNTSPNFPEVFQRFSLDIGCFSPHFQSCPKTRLFVNFKSFEHKNSHWTQWMKQCCVDT